MSVTCAPQKEQKLDPAAIERLQDRHVTGVDVTSVRMGAFWRRLWLSFAWLDRREPANSAGAEPAMPIALEMNARDVQCFKRI